MWVQKVDRLERFFVFQLVSCEEIFSVERTHTPGTSQGKAPGL
jgi:hypothetical protein